jgi:hypothetical protein
MHYSTPSEAGCQIIKMTWRVDGAFIVSDQPSLQREERTQFQLENDVLALRYAGHWSWFRKGPKRAPAV